MLHSRKHVNQILQTLEASLEGIEQGSGGSLHAKVSADEFHPNSMSLSAWYSGYTDVVEVKYDTKTDKYVLNCYAQDPGNKKFKWTTNNNISSKNELFGILSDLVTYYNSLNGNFS